MGNKTPMKTGGSCLGIAALSLMLLAGLEQMLWLLYSLFTGTPLVTYYSGGKDTMEFARSPWSRGVSSDPLSDSWWFIFVQTFVLLLISAVPLYVMWRLRCDAKAREAARPAEQAGLLKVTTPVMSLAEMGITPRLGATAPQEGIQLIRRGRVDDGIAVLEGILLTRPDDFLAHQFLGIAYGMNDQLETAVRHMETAMRLDPEDPQCHYNLGELYERQGSISEAMKEVEFALHLEPGYPRAQRAIARLRALPRSETPEPVAAGLVPGQPPGAVPPAEEDQGTITKLPWRAVTVVIATVNIIAFAVHATPKAMETVRYGSGLAFLIGFGAEVWVRFKRQQELNRRLDALGYVSTANPSEEMRKLVIKRDFASAEIRHWTLTGLMLAALVVMILNVEWLVDHATTNWVYATIAALFAWFGLLVHNGRCPACRKVIVTSKSDGPLYLPATCPKCKTQLR